MGLIGLYGTCINKIRFGKVLLDEYATWIANNEPNSESLENQKKYESCQNLSFSIICGKKVNIDNQTYSNYKILNFDKANLRNIIEESKTDYYIFMDNEIEIAPFALYEIAISIENKDTDLIYSDNDKIIDGKRKDPQFKPDFAIDTIRSKNYIGNFIVVKGRFLKAHIDIVEKLNDNFIYDLIFRITERTNRIMHISKILYHEKYFGKKVDVDDEKKIIEEHLQRSNIEYDKILDGKYLGQYKIQYKIKGDPLVSLVIPNKDHIDDLDKLLKSLEKTTYSNYEIVIVENNSECKKTFEYYDKIQKDKKVRIVKFNISYFNYSSIINFGVENANGDYVVLLNNDIEFITENWIEELLMYAQRSDVGICGAKLYFDDRSIQHAGVTIGTRGLAGHRYREVQEKDFCSEDYINMVQNLSAVTAACFIVEKKLYNKVLGFDEKLAVAFNDVDFCLKVREENYLIVYNPFVEAYHYESKSRGQDTDNPEKQKRFAREFEIFVKRWRNVIGKGDPYYNRNYRLDVDIPKINYNKIAE